MTKKSKVKVATKKAKGRAVAKKGEVVTKGKVAEIKTLAQKLAKAHKANDPGTKRVFWYADAKNKEVRLVEVSGSIDNIGAPMPVRLSKDPQRGINYESVLILLSVEDGEKLKKGQLSLPEGWVNPVEIKP